MPTSPVAYNSLGAVIGIAVLGSLVVALLALFVGYRHWQKGKAHQHLAVAYSSGRLDGSEYVMPGELARGRGTRRGAGAWAPGGWGAGLPCPSLDPEEAKRGAGGEKRGQICRDRTTVSGPGLSLTGQVTTRPVCSRRCPSQLQPLLLQPQLPHPVTVLTETPAPEQGQCWGREGTAVGGGRTPTSLESSILVCSLPLPPLPYQLPGSQLFGSLQVPERPGGAHGQDNHSTLPADWKHRREPPAGPLDRGRSLEAEASGEGGLCGPAPRSLGGCVSAAGSWALVPEHVGAWGGQQGLTAHFLPLPPHR